MLLRISIGIVVFLVVLGIMAWVVGTGRMGLPKNHPARYLRRGRRRPFVVVTAGDSITHATGSGNWVEMLRQRYDSGVDFVNAGVNGDLAWNLRQRLDLVVECQPDLVLILIGTNDVNATLAPRKTRDYLRNKGLPRVPDRRWYDQNMRMIFDRLQRHTDAEIGVFTLPILSEHLYSKPNRIAEEYSEAVERLANEMGITVLPLRERMKAIIEAEGTNSEPYDPNKNNLLQRSTLLHYLGGQSWNAISNRYGFRLLTDQVHLNDRAARIVEELAAEFIDQVRRKTRR